jgi:hypothetical protein
MWHHITIGDMVSRRIGGVVDMQMEVTMVDDKFIHCGPWKFARDSGAEVDEELGWGQEDEDGSIVTGSYLVDKHSVDFIANILAEIKAEDQ